MSDLQFIMYAVVMVFLSPVLLVSVLAFWGAVVAVIDSLIGYFTPQEAPYCDIDPRNHRSCYADENGNLWIGGMQVNQS